MMQKLNYDDVLFMTTSDLMPVGIMLRSIMCWWLFLFVKLSCVFYILFCQM